MFPQFLMCALDLMTWRRIRKLNRDGKVSRAENLLMTQMLFNTFAVMGVILFNGLGAFVASYFGLNIRGMIPELFGKLQLIVVLIGTSLMNAIFLHKPREKTKTNGKIVQVTKTNTKDSD
ncbi:unnamed protein product, partial [Mesorhabditis belari]|uniref:Uncharacterized protein n=1 Tax=Mesorhabditis belari TaxID=2138241 RepID=A0AAF3ER67_9BILA